MQEGKGSIGYVAYIGDVSKLFIVMNFPSNVYSDMLYNSNLNGITLLTLLICIFLISSLVYTIRFFLQKKKIIEEAKDSNDIHTAVSLLFENFIVIDVASRNYKYIEGMPETAEIPEIGSYDLFLDSLLERFPIQEEKEDAKVEGKRILLVEDNDINAEIAKMVITEYGYKLDRAVNGKDGFEKIQNKDKYYYNAVLMDIQMPIMTGYEATKAIRSLEDEYYKKIPIIAMSANAYDEDVKQAIESGMNAHIAKPFDVKVLIATLKKYSQ